MNRITTTLASLTILAGVLFGQTSGELLSQAQAAYNAKEYAKSAELYIRSHRAKANPTALYNAACSAALAGQTDRAFEYLDELAKLGYNRPDMVKEDADFASIRSDARWQPLVARFEENGKRSPFKGWKKPYRVLTDAPDVAVLQAKLGGGDQAVWLDGDVMTFVRRDKGNSLSLSGGVQEPMTKVGDDLWVARIQMPNWEEAFVSYTFLSPATSRVEFGMWRGPKAPTLPERTKALKGRIERRTYKSAALGEDRSLVIYLPPNSPKNVPAVFMADGGGATAWAEVLEPLILKGKVRPVAIVGVDSGGYRGDRSGGGYNPDMDFRAKEYVNGVDKDRFDRHLKFFTEEVPAYVAKEFGVSTRREDRVVTGFSNGGAFSAAVAFRKPEFAGTVIPLSLGVPPDVEIPARLPRMLFAAGTLESFSQRTADVLEKVRAVQPTATMRTYVAGHDPAMWELAFAELIPTVFPAR